MHIAAKNGIHHVIIANFARHVSPERYKNLKIDHLSVAAGESWAFVGSNGSGKSALARALAGELTLLSGQRESHFPA
jgi:molybdate transport system ATP-binding protein